MPAFSASATNVSLGSSISFTDASYGDIVSWNWAFEGGTPSSSTAHNPSGISYNTAGTYDVTLTITDAQGNSETLTKENYIHVIESYNMSNTTVTTCDALFYDSGGPTGNYSNNQNYTMTFYPSSEGAKVSVNFSSFNIQNATNNYWGGGQTINDYLNIYDGDNISATQIGQYYGTNSPGTITATNETGALTFVFHSNNSTNALGWVATVSCIYPLIEQLVTFEPEWNWWTPTVEMTLGELETLLGDNAILINSQDDGFVRYDGESWSGTLDTIVAGQMYRILTTIATEFTLSGDAVTSTITFLPGYNWFGYTGSQSKNVATAFGDFIPTEGDTITAENGTTATYTNGSWDDNFILMPGHGYVYHSNAQESRNITFE